MEVLRLHLNNRKLTFCWRIFLHRRTAVTGIFTCMVGIYSIIADMSTTTYVIQSNYTVSITLLHHSMLCHSLTLRYKHLKNQYHVKRITSICTMPGAHKIMADIHILDGLPFTQGQKVSILTQVLQLSTCKCIRFTHSSYLSVLSSASMYINVYASGYV